jgi:hypothetical protein
VDMWGSKGTRTYAAPENFGNSETSMMTPGVARYDTVDSALGRELECETATA